MKIEIRQTSASGSEALIRGHRIAVDRPVEKGGGNAGAMGGELFLAAVGGCFMSNLLAAIRAREAAISEVRVEVAGTLEGNPARFTGVELLVSAGGDGVELLPHLAEVADRGCVMMNTLRGSLKLSILTEPA